MKKYNLIYAKNTFLMCFVISLFAAVPLLIVSLLFDVVEHDILYSLYFSLVSGKNFPMSPSANAPKIESIIL